MSFLFSARYIRMHIQAAGLAHRVRDDVSLIYRPVKALVLNGDRYSHETVNHAAIHTCNQTNPQLCITRDARPCRGFLNLLRSHVAHYQEHGYASYLKFAGETGMVALPKSRLVFWRDVSELLLVERDAAEAQPKSE